MDTAALDTAAASASSLAAVQPAGGTQTRTLGPCLYVGMGEASMVEQINAWGIARDSDMLDLRANLADTQTVLAAAFDQARSALNAIVDGFRTEAESMRQQTQNEAAQGLARLEHVVAAARQRFDAQDVRFTQDLAELARRIEVWALAEPARIAATVVAAPSPPWVQQTSPGGTISFYPSLGPAGPMLPPYMGPAAAPTTPPRAQDGWASYRSPSEPQMPDPWAAAAAQQQQQQQPQQPQQQPQHFEMNTPGYMGGGGGKGGFPGVLNATGSGLGGGKGGFPGVFDATGSGSGGKGGYPYPKEMRIDARGWASENKKLDITTGFDAFQIWRDRAMMFLSRERPDVRRLLAWAETQTAETLAAGIVTQAAHFGVSDLANVEYAVHDGIKMTILDSLLGRARNCVERGCELWRSLCAQWSGAAPQLQHAKACRYQTPLRCKTVPELWARLPAWERRGEEAVS